MKNKILGEINRLDELPVYSPPGHSGTTNRRLVLAEEAEDFEMVHGSIAPGGEAEEHCHPDSYQAIYVLSGLAQVRLNGTDDYCCQAGDTINIPKGVKHFVKSVGETNLEMIIVYSPPISRQGA